MKKLTLCTFIILPILTACSNANRTIPVLVLDEKTISGDPVEHPRLKVPEDRTYLPPPTYGTSNQQIDSIPLPPPRPYNLGSKK